MNKGFERTTDLCFAIFMARDQTAKREPEREREREGGMGVGMEIGR